MWSGFAFDDADGVEGLELIAGEAEGVGAVVEFLEFLAQAREAVFFGEGGHVGQVGRGGRARRFGSSCCQSRSSALNWSTRRWVARCSGGRL